MTNTTTLAALCFVVGLVGGILLAAGAVVEIQNRSVANGVIENGGKIYRLTEIRP